MPTSEFKSDLFIPFSVEHFLPVFCFGIVTWWTIHNKHRWELKTHHHFVLFVSLLLCGMMIFKSAYRYYLGIFDPTEDFPFHLCNFLCLIYPLQAIYKKRWFFGVLYFWVLVGTFQAILTPDLQKPFPDPEYFRYWLEHCGLVMLVLHGLFVLDYKVYPKDLKNAMIGANLFLVFSLTVNFLTGGNYFYSIHKPENPSLLDWLGPWPWYLLTGQIAMLILFCIYYLPIHYRAKKYSHINGSA